MSYVNQSTSSNAYTQRLFCKKPLSVACPEIWTPDIHFERNENETEQSEILGQKKTDVL